MDALALTTPRTATGEIAVWRLYLLRAGYLLIAAGMGSIIWPKILHHTGAWDFYDGAVSAMLGALTALCAYALRYPLRMLPIMFFEIGWKSIWLIVVALPAWQSGKMDAATAGNVSACAFIIVLIPIVPWDYVWQNFVTAKSERWW
jgi:hypothetical protein